MRRRTGWHPRSLACGTLVLVVSACAPAHRGGRAHAVTPGVASMGSAPTSTGPGPAIVSGDALEAAEAALASEDAARAVALFGRFLASAPASDPRVLQAYRGLARAHEQLGDCRAALVAYATVLARFPGSEHESEILARQGACEAEVGEWEASAASFRAIHERPGQLPSVLVEALTREGYALFNLDRHDEADRVLARADEVFTRASEAGSERFATFYFVGMARFYRAAILHLRFRDVEITLPEKVMEAAFKQKLELLSRAQDAYNHTIAAKHMFWVSASGYQLGHLFGEFYDDLMHAPVPEWLDARQREIYYRELKKQLKPVFEKAVWVFEKNLETARRLGYESPFIDQTQAKLARMQSVLLSSDPDLGAPHPRLAAELDEAVEPPDEDDGDEAPPRTPADRKLFVPGFTPL